MNIRNLLYNMFYLLQYCQSQNHNLNQIRITTQKMKKKFNLSIDCQQAYEMQASIYSQIGKDGLRFLRQDIHVGPQGITTISGDHISSLLKINKQSLNLASKILGKGASCVVQQALYVPLNKKVAIKTINIYDREKRHQIMNDIRILLKNSIKDQNSGYDCNFIVKLYGAYFDQGSVKVILQLMDVGSIQTIIRFYRIAKITPQINEGVLAKIALQIMCGLSHLHSQNFVHRDVKPGNILLNSRGEVKVTDFGISKQFVDGIEYSKTFVGTRAYMSPQRIKCLQYDYKSDVWGFGLILYELATGIHPFAGKTQFQMQQLFLSGQQLFQFPIAYSQKFKNFLQKCLEIQPIKRVGCVELMGHPWILTNLSNKVSIKKWLQQLSVNVIPQIQKK